MKEHPGIAMILGFILSTMLYFYHRYKVLRKHKAHVVDLYNDDDLMRKVRRDQYKIMPFQLLVFILGMVVTILLILNN